MPGLGFRSFAASAGTDAPLRRGRGAATAALTPPGTGSGSVHGCGGSAAPELPPLGSDTRCAWYPELLRFGPAACAPCAGAPRWPGLGLSLWLGLGSGSSGGGGDCDVRRERRVSDALRASVVAARAMVAARMMVTARSIAGESASAPPPGRLCMQR